METLLYAGSVNITRMVTKFSQFHAALIGGQCYSYLHNLT